MRNSSIVDRIVLKNGRESLGLVARSWGLLGLKNFIRVSDLDQSLQQQSIRHLRADVTIFPGTVAFQEVLALPAIVFDLYCGHIMEPYS